MHIHPQPLRMHTLLDAQHAQHVKHANLAEITLTVQEQVDAAKLLCCLKEVTTYKKTAGQDGHDCFAIMTCQQTQTKDWTRTFALT